MITDRITSVSRTDGLITTAAAMVLGLGVIVTTGVTASEADTAITPLMVLAGSMHVVLLFLGSARWIAASSAPVLGAIVIESGFSDDPSWMRSIVLGCCWFVAMELSWEAIDRRDGARHTTAVTMRRVQEVVTVVGIALAIGLLSATLASIAPVRSVAMQALVLGGLLVAFVAVVRHIVADGTPS